MATVRKRRRAQTELAVLNPRVVQVVCEAGTQWVVEPVRDTSNVLSRTASPQHGSDVVRLRGAIAKQLREQHPSTSVIVRIERSLQRQAVRPLLQRCRWRVSARPRHAGRTRATRQPQLRRVRARNAARL